MTTGLRLPSTRSSARKTDHPIHLIDGEGAQGLAGDRSSSEKSASAVETFLPGQPLYLQSAAREIADLNQQLFRGLGLN